jgi:hypothetical protein
MQVLVVFLVSQEDLSPAPQVAHVYPISSSPIVDPIPGSRVCARHLRGCWCVAPFLVGAGTVRAVLLLFLDRGPVVDPCREYDLVLVRGLFLCHDHRAPFCYGEDLRRWTLLQMTLLRCPSSFG